MKKNILSLTFLSLFWYMAANGQVKFVYGNETPPVMSDTLAGNTNAFDEYSDANITPNKAVAFVIHSQIPTEKQVAAPAHTPKPVLAAAKPAPTETESETTPATVADTTTWRIKVYPPSDVSDKPELQAFVKQLLAAVKARDVSFISQSIHPEIMFGDAGNYDYGKTAFLQTWQLGDSNSPFWLYLEKALKIGGAYYRNPATNEIINDEWVFPHVCTMEIDPAFMYTDVLVITSDRANVRSKPELKAPIIAKFNHDLVRVDYAASVLPSQKQALKGVSGRGEKDWYKVSSLDQKINGYVNWLVAWNPRGLHLHISQTLDKWYINAWIGSGD